MVSPREFGYQALGFWRIFFFWTPTGTVREKDSLQQTIGALGQSLSQPIQPLDDRKENCFNCWQSIHENCPLHAVLILSLAFAKNVVLGEKINTSFVCWAKLIPLWAALVHRTAQWFRILCWNCCTTSCSIAVFLKYCELSRLTLEVYFSPYDFNISV